MSEKELEAAKTEEVQMSVVYPEHEEAGLLKTAQIKEPQPGPSGEGKLTITFIWGDPKYKGLFNPCRNATMLGLGLGWVSHIMTIRFNVITG